MFWLQWTRFAFGKDKQIQYPTNLADFSWFWTKKVVLNNILAFAKAFESVSTYVEKTLIGSDNIEETDPVKRVL